MKEKPRNPWKIAAIALICLVVAGALFVLFAMGAFNGLLYRNRYDNRESDRLEYAWYGSWGQVNQPLALPEGWRQIVQDSPFRLGGLRMQYGLDEWSTRYRLKGKTYPSIDGSTVMLPMAVEFARQHLGLLDEQDARLFAEFSTTGVAYERLFNLFDDVYSYGVNEQGEWTSASTGRPLDLFLGTLYSDRELTMAERNGITPIAKPICKDAFVFITHRENPVESLTIQQVKGIFSGAITNWRDVGGADEAIRAFQREPGSGSQTGMEDLVMQGTPMAPAEMVGYVDSMAGLIEQVAEYRNTPAGIGYTYKYYIDNLYKNPDIKILQIEGVAPTQANIIDETYPLSVNYYGVIRAGEEEGPGGLFLEWILSAEGQVCVKQAGTHQLTIDS